MSSIKRVEGGKVADVIESVPFMVAQELIKGGKAVYANTAAPAPVVAKASDDAKRATDLEAALKLERDEKSVMFDELEKAAKEKAELQKRLADLEAQAAKNTTANGGKK